MFSLWAIGPCWEICTRMQNSCGRYLKPTPSYRFLQLSGSVSQGSGYTSQIYGSISQGSGSSIHNFQIQLKFPSLQVKNIIYYIESIFDTSTRSVSNSDFNPIRMERSILRYGKIYANQKQSYRYGFCVSSGPNSDSAPGSESIYNSYRVTDPVHRNPDP